MLNRCAGGKSSPHVAGPTALGLCSPHDDLCAFPCEGLGNECFQHLAHACAKRGPKLLRRTPLTPVNISFICQLNMEKD
jgi:hypothetical protein